ncbi:hypothetical protein BCR37DRAFT_389402 [Protomyces lactucae-debilis]|uniref:Extracellular membrane protein CFEM domain-containing protein n=1 Tax=Protomyces lactucae-debilis TaxID=2754530 RepID=A0A1Y2EXK1_PROLT|nr:uncharacterized protein BCR37DRAFT_389402 [Protomyces lactucae-debilis]ORY76300.1 hypothetical protein BCR37DRAFT_389402 [Protomyces lactucae-debilis]
MVPQSLAILSFIAASILAAYPDICAHPTLQFKAVVANAIDCSAACSNSAAGLVKQISDNNEVCIAQSGVCISNTNGTEIFPCLNKVCGSHVDHSCKCVVDLFFVRHLMRGVILYKNGIEQPCTWDDVPGSVLHRYSVAGFKGTSWVRGGLQTTVSCHAPDDKKGCYCDSAGKAQGCHQDAIVSSGD